MAAQNGQRAARVRVEVEVRVVTGSADVISAYTENISSTGVFVRCEEPFTVGTAVQVRLALASGEIAATGVVVRVGPGTSGQIGMGIMFSETPEASRRAIEALVMAG